MPSFISAESIGNFECGLFAYRTVTLRYVLAKEDLRRHLVQRLRHAVGLAEGGPVTITPGWSRLR